MSPQSGVAIFSRPVIIALMFAVSSVLAGCSLGGGSVSPTVSAPEAETTVLPEADAAGLALAATRELYDEAPVVVLAADGDVAAQARAASVAVALGAPLLVTPASGGSADGAASGTEAAGAPAGPVADELERLSTEAVLSFGPEPTRWAGALDREVDVVPAPADVDELASAAGVSLSEPEPVRARRVTRAVAGLSGDEPSVLVVRRADFQAATAPEDADELPDHEAAEPLESLTVFTSPAPDNVAATATARAAGARVMVVADGDPRADEEAIAALSEEAPGTVLGMGEGIGDAERLRRRIEVAATGVQLPGGGQVLFPHRRMVALYGHPDGAALGVLGEQPLRASIQRAQRVASEYEQTSDMPVVPAFEIIASIASGSAGEDGNYSILTEVDRLRRWVDAAGDAGMYVVLDLQPGRSDFLTQARHYEELLREPHVGLALDPEWRLAPGQVHLSQIGSVGIQEVNQVVTWLADLTRANRLPQKVLLLHQFQLAMIRDRDQLDTSRDELGILIHADGHGTPELKRATWNTLTEDAPSGVWWGWKNFYDEDTPTWTPRQTTAVRPPPLFISYQ